MQAFLSQERLSPTTMSAQDSPRLCTVQPLAHLPTKVHSAPCFSIFGLQLLLCNGSATDCQEALQAWLKLLSPEERRAAQSKMGATLPASAEASDEPTQAAAADVPAPTPSQADPSTTPIPEEPNPILLAQRE